MSHEKHGNKNDYIRVATGPSLDHAGTPNLTAGTGRARTRLIQATVKELSSASRRPVSALGITLLCVGLVCLPTAASAHAALVKSDPASRAVLAHSPQQIELCFNERIELKFSKVELKNANGQSLTLGDLKAGNDPKCMVTAVSDMRPGSYSVHYRVLSQDGHVVDYGYQFIVEER
ncbi:copper resistance CopC family protein [Bradyrhizobium sp. Ai1a-2]|uniref:copper resistance CopC family protein n=1 Tax=Bradyrhizobium sp. Ai1a-2 TaxID=196490 RepID=UPI000A07A4C3|nr:copper resistance CopC family protein [Bradyrhizobium sp. Ai1a-2]